MTHNTNIDSNSNTSFLNPLSFLRLEALAWFIATLGLYHYFQGSWWVFAALFFTPDISIVAYMYDSEKGAFFYNIFHTELVPLILIGYSFLFPAPLLLQIGIIWLSHINFDRILGIGLKYSDNFKHTHLGFISFDKQSKN